MEANSVGTDVAFWVMIHYVMKGRSSYLVIKDLYLMSTVKRECICLEMDGKNDQELE